MPKILVVDDVVSLAEQYAYDLKRIGEFETIVAASGEDALDIITSEDIDCIILDLEMPGMDGFEVLRRLKKSGSRIPVIVYTGTGNYDRCIQAIRLGAHSFIDKAESMAKVVTEVENALEMARLDIENRALRRRLDSESSLIGSSPAMLELLDQIRRIAQIPSPVLIVGESGSGKELIAREIHRQGVDARAKPFVAINCAALPEQLVESELFGHEKGAFTGADRVHRGAFERASGGTLFLDEIGELPPATQAKLLRVLERSEITRVGGEMTIKITTRVLAATNRSLEAESEAGTFRSDLYFRLNVHELRVPPLRERRSDIPNLTHHFMATCCERFGLRPKKLSAGVLEALTDYEWTRNNVRELRNIIERMIIASDSDEIELQDVPAEIRSEEPTQTQPSANRSFKDLKAEAERRIIISALERYDWHISKTAEDLDLYDHASLLKIMRRLSIEQPD